MEEDITKDEGLMRAAQDAEFPLIGFQSVIMGLDHAVRRGSMSKKRLIAIEELLRPYANVSGMKAVLMKRRKDVPPHIIIKFCTMLDHTRGTDPDMTGLMYNLYFKIIYSLHYGEIEPDYENIIKKITDMAKAINKLHHQQKAIRKQERQAERRASSIEEC
jgi:hypothetical protein